MRGAALAGIGASVLTGILLCPVSFAPLAGQGAGGDQAAAAEPTTVLHNGRIFTADPSRPWAEALAVRGDRIVAVGADTAVLAGVGPEAVAVDLGGRLVVPGFNDAHVHVGASPEAEWLEVGREGGILADPGWAEVREAVARAASRVPPGVWIRGTIGPTVLRDVRATRHALDSIAPDHRVLLVAASGHGTLANTGALETLGVSLDPAPVPGGWYGRGPGGEITGQLREAAEVAARRRLASMQGIAANAAEYRSVAGQLVRWGVTSAQQHAASLPIEEVVEAVSAADLPIRWSVYRWPLPRSTVETAWPGPVPVVDGEGAPGAGVRGVKWMLDGTPLEHGIALRAPYADRPGTHGRMNYSPSEIRSILAGGLEHGEQLALHVGGDSTLALVFDLMEELADAETWRARRVRIEHADVLMADQLTSAAELGVVLVPNPLHFTLDLGPWLGDRAGRIQLLRSPLEAGVPVALGTDAAGQGRNPFLNLMFAVMHPANPDEAVSLEQAVMAYTRGSAYAERVEDRKGTLAPGMLADLAVLSQDIFAVPGESLPGTVSVLTLVGGEVVYDSGALQLDG